ncbi:MAG: DUF4190 domain-containing protein [Cellulomonadaceae bacterium]|jgi:hypothetical protein|nr:DUF4190 domain-containing protein [Cellulomonadaceae bacterium]
MSQQPDQPLPPPQPLPAPQQFPLPEAPPQGSPSPHPAAPLPQQAYNPQQKTDGFAIAALIFGLLGIIGGLLGVIFGIIALVRIGKTQAKGKGMAIWGIILSALGIILAIVGAALLIGGTLGAVNDSIDNPVGGQPASVSLCMNLPDSGHLADATVVDCATSHNAQIFALVNASDRTFPGVDALDADASHQCSAAADPVINLDAASLDNIDISYVTPTQASWALGDRQIICIGNTADGSPMPDDIFTFTSTNPSPAS